ncbi:hypothetical protein ACFY8P_06775 [Streptomyces sp. NPDC012693]|jgi:hypothetical protein|uniref:hypothetical protein n=1 Tax=unclassified Streptomyces TaxID=2593676 RepID=UPI002030842F|nr:hypothetical protein [Streptomyces sp. MSC1_001]
MRHLDVVRMLGLDAPAHQEGDVRGHVLPEDFELLLQAVPQGVIAGSVLLTRPEGPVHSLEDLARPTALRVADMKAALISREQELRLPFHPEPGGMVPWGRTANDGVLLWDTGAADPADWTTVLTDSDFQLWLELPFSASEFVARAVSGRPDGIPAFETNEEFMSGSWWQGNSEKRAAAMALANPDIGAAEEIVTRVRSIGVPGVRQYAEELLTPAVEKSFGALPPDYLAVMREFPGGVIAGVRVFPVGAGLRWLDEGRGFLQWGELQGKAFGWLTLASDPREWRVAYIEPDASALTCLEDHTFATFLRRRLGGDNSLF